ncbi:MAG: sugar phosphate isomerase/epimerase, partial [Planctomycetota bacterium]
MQFGYITNGFSHHRLEDALEVLADLGYRSVGITLDVNHLDPMTCTPAEVARIAKQLVRLRLQPTIETGGRYVLDPWRKHQPNLCSATPAERRRRVDFYARAAAIGADLGAQV